MSEHWHQLGLAAYRAGRYAEAADLIGRAIEADGRIAGYHANRGTALKAAGQLEPAIACYRTALRLEPVAPVVWSNLGNALRELGRPDEAALPGMAAACLAPDTAEILFNLANTWQALRRLEPAIALFDRAIRLKPGFAAAQGNMGLALQQDGRIEAALARYDAALALTPDDALVHFNRATARLLRGDLAVAWADYEWRWRCGFKTQRPRNFPQARWSGETIAGRTVLLHAEQGLGDTLLLCRYAPLVAARGAKVLLEVQPALVPLLVGLAGVAAVFATGDPLPAFDNHCPLASLPAAFATDRASIPANVPYLKADPGRIDRWRPRLPEACLRIGIVWAGSPAFDANQRRSAPLAAFAPLAARAGMRLISLQKHHGLDQLERLPAGMVVERLGDDLDADGAFLDTAAVMTTLDLVVGIDSAATQLAGALGVPVWVALDTEPHWPAGQTGERHPWYPTMRLFRQTRRGDWSAVFDRIAAAISILPQGSRPSRG